MECPRLHGSMECIHLSADFSDPQTCYFCTDCHGVWMRSHECRSILGVDAMRLQMQSEADYVALLCPHCQTTCRLSFVAIANNQTVSVRVCPRCQSCFFDGGSFAKTYFEQVKYARSEKGKLGDTPVDHLSWRCCDCGTTMTTPENAFDARIGYCCAHCHNTMPILSERKISNQLVTFHNMEIKIDHWLSTTRSRIAVTPVEPCLLDVTIHTLTPLQRIFRFGRRITQFGGKLRRHIDATECIDKQTPFHVFLKQRGVSECLADLVAIGNFSITFKPHSIVFEIDAFRLGTEIRQRFEATTRRLLIAYERFVQLSHLYTMPEDDTALKGQKKSPTIS